MSILIKGMEMPFAGSIKTIVIYPDGTVRTRQQDPLPYTAVPVPPHGDLIDKSGAEVLSWYKKDEGDFCDGVLFVLDKLDELPVIIPAEEGE